MKKVVVVFAALFLFLMCCSAFAGTNEVLTSLEELKAAAHARVSERDFLALVAKVNAQINIAKRDSSISQDFIQAAINARGTYCFACDMDELGARDEADEAFAKADRFLDQTYDLAQ